MTNGPPSFSDEGVGERNTDAASYTAASSGLSTLELPPVTLCDTCTPEQLAALKQYPSNAAPVLVGYANQYDRVREESQRIDKRL
jgi:hypothetical protein